ncbi:hypothetical protein H8E52_12370 [bacterium]|nr:hypothetical protein [bacterium]
MLTAFIGVGVYTFHPPPEQHEKEIRNLNQAEQAIRDSGSPEGLSEEQRNEIAVLNQRQNQLNDASDEALEPWGRSTSIILIVFATLTMIISLVRAHQLPVISNGLLLGGLFSMLYGIAWIIATDTSVTRFLVMSAALLITLGLGYVRFVRQGNSSRGDLAQDRLEAPESTDMERRIQALETRLAEAALALGHNR